MEKTFKVEKKHSAVDIGSGDLEVLSTPSMIAFMENVAKEEAATRLTTGETTVGIELTIKHLQATAIGETIQVKATCTEQKKQILFYEVEAFAGEDLIGKGQHKRAIVDAAVFMENI